MKQQYRLYVTIILCALSPFFIISKDPELNYEKVFDQEDIYKSHGCFFDEIGCLHNVNERYKHDTDEERNKRKKERKEKFEYLVNKALQVGRDEDGNEIGYCMTPYTAVGKDSKYDAWCMSMLREHKKWLEQECLEQLEWERTKAKYLPVTKLLYTAAMLAGVPCGAKWLASYTDQVTMGGVEHLGFTASLYKLKDVAEQIPSLILSKDSSIKNAENAFALNKCYIPHSLWPRIIKAFMLYHRDELNRQKHLDFLDYALGFTVYKPKLAIKVNKNYSIDDVKKELNKRIDFFFKDYKFVTSEQTESLQKFKFNVCKFVDSLHDKQVAAPNAIYLHGSGGIGKTYFAQQLSKWIDELLPESVTFENPVIDSAEKLEGSVEYAGVFLNVLRNQLVQEKHGSVVVLDEVSWLAKRPDMNDSIKRTFDVKNTKIIARCFGSDMQGPIQLKKPNMLVMLAGNIPASAIQDKALASRFLHLNFPVPHVSVLQSYASNIIRSSDYIDQEAKSKITEHDVKIWVDSLPLADRNFRYIEQNVEVCCKPGMKEKLKVTKSLVKDESSFTELSSLHELWI